MKPTSCWRQPKSIRSLSKGISPSNNPKLRRLPSRPPNAEYEPSSPPSPSAYQTITGSRKFALTISLFTAFGISAYCSSLYFSYRRHIASVTDVDDEVLAAAKQGDISAQRDVSSRYDAIAEEYDDNVGTQEWLMGMRAKRKHLVDQARGHVLEVSVGTGRNTAFYAERLEEQSRRKERSRKKSEEQGGWDLVKGAVGFSDDKAAAEKEDNEIKSLTFMDKSIEMVDVARRKWDREIKKRTEAAAAKQGSFLNSVPGRTHDVGDHVEVRWVRGDAERADGIPPAPDSSKSAAQQTSLIPHSDNPSISTNTSASTESPSNFLSKIKSFIPTVSPNSPPPTITTTSPSSSPSPTPHKYDTILQTHGLCSTPSPHHLLLSLSSHVNPSGGTILLLEHGLSHYSWLNGVLANTAPGHADRWGCWWNRDVGRVVEGAAREAGLVVVGVRRWHGGSTWEVRLRFREEGDRDGDGSGDTGE